ncbi:MAG: hypothetical protein U1E25_09115 [Methylocystis sp.]
MAWPSALDQSLRRAYRADLVAAYFALLTAWNVFDAAVEGGARRRLTASEPSRSDSRRWLCSLCSPGGRRAPRFRHHLPPRGAENRRSAAGLYNLPFSQIKAATLRVEGDGGGDVMLALSPSQRIGYLHLWPFARPLRFAHPEPTLRGLADARQVGEILGRALVAAAAERGDMCATGHEDAAIAASGANLPMPAGNAVPA